MEFLLITDEHDTRIAINVNQIIALKELTERTTEIVTANGSYVYPYYIDETVSFIEKKYK